MAYPCTITNDINPNVNVTLKFFVGGDIPTNPVKFITRTNIPSVPTKGTIPIKLSPTLLTTALFSIL